MANPNNLLLKITHFHRAKSFRISAALILTTLTLLVAGATTAATSQTYTDLYNFDGTHGSQPEYPQLLAQGLDGDLYGTTFRGGTDNFGVVFKITPSGKLKVLYNFDVEHGALAQSGLTLATGGNFFGATKWGGGSGACGFGCGVIFKVTKSEGLIGLHAFTGGTEGGYPMAPPIQGADGNLYGTTAAGTAYKVTPRGTFTSLGSIPGSSQAPLLQARDGNFYGTTYDGGTYAAGTVFKMTPRGIVTVVHNFDDTHGKAPTAPLIQGSDGAFYGTTGSGGGWCNCGVVFKLTSTGAFTVLHNFYGDSGDSYGGLVQASDGNFYGLAYWGGTTGAGALYQITTAGVYSILYSFDGGADGAGPISTPMQHTNGKIYGLMGNGGTSNLGVIFSLDLGLAPFVRTVPPLRKVGKTVGVLGGGLTGTSVVSFNGTPATFTVVSDTYLTATVPNGAITGFLTVTTPGGTLKSNEPFRVQPVILSFSPTSGPPGTSVTITGNSFTQTGKVSFGWVKATDFTVDSDTEVTATVPTGAKTGPIVITTAGGKDWSSGTFTVTQ